MRGTLTKVITATFGLAALLVILENAGNFSQILESGSRSYATAFQALTGKARPGTLGPVAYSSRRAGGRATA